MQVKILDRVVILNSLKPQANMLEIAIQREIKKKVFIDEATMIAVEWKQNGEQVNWNREKDVPVEIEFTKPELLHMRAIFKDLDARGAITDEIYDTAILVGKDVPDPNP